MVRLNLENLARIRDRLPVPTYDRSQVRPGIVHFGVGGFHRAHQAMYVDALLNAGPALDWGIVGVGTLPRDRRMHRVMAAQDCLYTLVEKHPDGTLQSRVIGSIVDYLFAPDDPEAVLVRLVDPAIRIVSLTITEGGYHVNQMTGEFDSSDVRIQKDLQPGAIPSTTFGFITEALIRRREAGTEPFVVVSCDNIQANGDVARRMIGAFARLRDRDLGAWISERVSFPNSMVDRITPVTTDADQQRLAEQFDVDDAWPVSCEPFSQWVLADRFPTGRPPLEDVGVQLVEDVEPYELMKLRLLNASHQGLCYLGFLHGYQYVDEVCQDPLFVRFLLGYMDDEATPSLAPVPGLDLAAYKRQLIERFANAEIRDTLARLCAESSDRIPKWLVPVVRHRLDNGGQVRRSALIITSWARYAEGVDEAGQPIEVVDRRKDEVTTRARRQREEPLAFLDPSLFGDLREQPRFTEPYLASLDSLHSHGARATLQSWEDTP
jgi:mannitol 2-dehydrogenase